MHDWNGFTIFERHEQKMRGCDSDMVKAYRSAQQRKRRIEREKAESMSYYKAHKTEIETGRRAALILSVLCRISHEAQYLTIEDILSKADNSEINFYYDKLCKGVYHGTLL